MPDELKAKKKNQIVFFFLSGPFANLLLMLIARVFGDKNMLFMDILFWINVYLFVENMFPLFLKKNDVGKLKYYLKGRTKFIATDGKFQVNSD